MTLKKLLFHNDNSNYIAHYGWQKNFDDEMTEFGYINSYKSAADELVELSHPDLYIFPIIFCYRQYLELLLKNLYRQSVNDTAYKRFLKEVSHDLDKVFIHVKPLLQIKYSDKVISLIEETTSILNELDKGSYNFRYSTDRKLNRSIEKDLCINTKALKEVIDCIDDYLRMTYDSV